MRLTSIEIKGFKSFAEKTTVHFGKDITGVVGPNGCGKSNIVDAVRWVLGEQKSKTLRSEKMENVIFNGTKKRKASGMAEVCMTFENTRNTLPTEYANVSIKRILFRNGDSEFRLNDVNCRLKDITNLFLDTGIGSDSYAIIELGMVDDILSDRDNSRLKLMEQAAGISKFKIRKRETLNKLKATEADLDRVEDLLFEIQNNLKSLEQQARRAQRFQKIKEQYKELSITVSQHQISSFNQRYKKLLDRQTAENDRILEVDTHLKNLEAQLEKLRASLIEQERNLSGDQKVVNEIIELIKDLENRKNLLAEQSRYITENKGVLIVQIEEAKEKVANLEKEIQETKSRQTTSEEKLAEMTGHLDREKHALEKLTAEQTEMQSQLKLKTEVVESVNQVISDLDKQYAVCNSKRETLLNQRQQNREESAGRQASLEEVKLEIETQQRSEKELERDLKKLEQAEKNLKAQVTALQKMMEESKSDLNKESRKLDARQNEHDLTKSLIDNLEGYPESIKFLKKNTKWAKKAPLLSDIIYCKEQYRVAIETLLEPYLNHYIVEDETDAISAINLLQDASKGRANFFMLKALRTYQPSTPMMLENALPATEVIEVDEPYNQLAAFLLDNVYFVDDNHEKEIDKLKKLVESHDANQPVFITKSGRMARTPYSISGGAAGLFEGVRIGRAKNLEKLTKEIEKIEKSLLKRRTQISQFEQDAEKLEKSSKAEQIEEKKLELQSLRQKLAAEKTKSENHLAFLQKQNERETDIETALTELAGQIAQLETQLNTAQEERKKQTAELGKFENEYSKQTISRNSKSEEFNEFNILFHQQKNLLEGLKKDIQFKQHRVEELQQNMTTGHEKIEEGKTQLKANAAVLQDLEQQLDNKYDEKEKLEQALSSLETEYFDRKGEVNELEKKIRQNNDKKQQHELIVTEIKDAITEIKIQLNAMKDRLSIEFGVNIDILLDCEASEIEDVEALQAKAEKLKNRIDNYGEINPMAVEAYEEMKERYDFIEGQKNDLTQSRETLLTTISEIENTAKEKLMEAFTHVRTNFIEVFRTLFREEDQCDLVMLSPENPLESKIEIIAQPKGKKPLVINQLSGGEKTLTALALLFALYLLKPAPFCILDEVDAPLDDTNIGKFNAMIRQFSDKSQFILVTHNKQTMSHVDRIYGITMAEQGVSKVVPVDFSGLN